MLEQKKSSKNTEYPEFEDFGQKFPLKDRKIEGYLISLLLKAPLEKSKEIVKKLKKEDFLNENLADVFEKLENYLEDRKSEINVKAFINKFEDEQKNLISELYMWDSDEDEESNEFPKNIEKELEEVSERVKKDSIRKQLKNLAESIKIAEIKKEEDELERLTKKFEKLSKSLL